MQTKAIRRVAAIDIGTNSVRLARGVMNDGRFCMEQKDLETTRIGEGTTTTDRLSDEPMRRTADAVAFFARQAADSGYALLGAYATSAVREAPNKDEFLALCRARGVEVEVLWATPSPPSPITARRRGKRACAPWRISAAAARN